MFTSQKNPIEKLRLRYIATASIAFAIIIGLVLIAINIMAYARVYASEVSIASMIARNGGEVPAYSEDPEFKGGPTGNPLLDLIRTVEVTRESNQQLRYFTVEVDAQGQITDVNTSHIAAIDDTIARTVHANHQPPGRNEGSFGYGVSTYFYSSADNDKGGRMFVAVDGTNEIRVQQATVLQSAFIGIAFFVLFTLIVMLLSRRMVEPFERNLHSQQQFITNASHELKTPLAIIQANTELQEMVGGATEQTGEIKRQVDRMTDLVSRLVMLARLQEMNALQIESFNVSEVVAQVAQEWRVPVEQAGKSFSSDVREGVTAKTDRRMFREMVNILCDNANKYCDEGGHVAVRLTRAGSRAQLAVSNTYAEGEGQDFSRFFERFYREDESHNSARKGAGIGLSMASQIAEDSGGSIRVTWSGGMITFTVTLPA